LNTHKDKRPVEFPWICDQSLALTTERHPCPWRYSNPQSKQASGRSTTP